MVEKNKITWELGNVALYRHRVKKQRLFKNYWLNNIREHFQLRDMFGD